MQTAFGGVNTCASAACFLQDKSRWVRALSPWLLQTKAITMAILPTRKKLPVLHSGTLPAAARIAASGGHSRLSTTPQAPKACGNTSVALRVISTRLVVRRLADQDGRVHGPRLADVEQALAHPG